MADRILVTGGAGFIGSAVVRRIIETTDAEVLLVDKLTYASNLSALDAVSENPRYAFRKADIADFQAMKDAFFAFKPDAVLHLAAESHVDRSIDGPADFIQTNVVGTFALLQAALAYWRELPEQQRLEFRFVHISTDEVFGTLGADGLFAETTAYDPSSPYSASKAASDHLAKAWHRTYGLPTMVTYASNNYGPWQFPEKLIPLMTINALEGLPLPVYGKGANVRDWLHVEDHARALLAVLERGRVGSCYCIGSRQERSNIEVVKAICAILDELSPKAFPHADLIKFVQDRPGHDLRYAIDPSRAENELNWSPSRNFQAGIADTVRWYIDNRDWWEKVRGGVYRGQRLGTLAPEARSHV